MANMLFRCSSSGGWLVLILMSGLSCAHAQDLQLGAIYQCPNGVSFKVFSCAGTGNADPCDVEASAPGQTPQRGKSPRAQVMMLVPACRVQTPGEAKAAPGGVSSSGGSLVDANGFKIGDEVNASTAGGWYVARILRANGNTYFVRLGSVDVWKTYPTELRRLGPLTDVDRAHGLFALHDKVQVNVEGRWIDGEITTEMGMEYQVTLPGNGTAWATAQQMRLVAAKQSSPPAVGQPPGPGMVGCAGKFEGRYAGSAPGSPTITFRSGKATMRDMSGEEQVLECWTAGDKIVLREPGKPETDMPIDVNDDGTLQTPLWGELKRKGK